MVMQCSQCCIGMEAHDLMEQERGGGAGGTCFDVQHERQRETQSNNGDFTGRILPRKDT